LTAGAVQSFGAFMLYEWKRGDETQAYAVPGYIYLVLGLGVAASISNALSYIGACVRSVCLLSTSLCALLFVLLLEMGLAAVLFYEPSLVDTKVCLPDDTACLQRVDNLFKDPSAHAGRWKSCESGLAAAVSLTSSASACPSAGRYGSAFKAHS